MEEQAIADSLGLEGGGGTTVSEVSH